MNEAEQVEQQMKKLSEERNALFEQMKPLQDKAVVLYDEIRKLEERRDQLRLADGSGPDWKTMLKELAEGGGGSMLLYRHFEKRLREEFDMWHSGYWSDTMEASVKLKVERTDKSEQMNLAGVKHFAPLMTPHEDGYVWFAIFENSLSRFGSFELRAKPDLSELVLTKRENEVKTFTSAEAAVKYIRENHWYGDREREEDDD